MSETTLVDKWQELVTRCGFSMSIDEDGVFVSENKINGRTARFPDGISAVSGLHLEIIENLLLENASLRTENARLSAPISDEVWNGRYEHMGSRSRETVNAIIAARKS